MQAQILLNLYSCKLFCLCSTDMIIFSHNVIYNYFNKIYIFYFHNGRYIICHWLTYLLTPWCRILLEKLTGLQLVKKFPRISRNPKVHYRTHKCPPPVSILGQPNPVHIPTSHLLEIYPNIIHLSTPRSPQRSHSLRFPQQDPIHHPLLAHTRHMPNQSHWHRR